MTNTVEMVVQKCWTEADPHQNAIGDCSSSWSFEQSPKMPPRRSNCTANTENRPPITRQLAINTLAAMHRRYSLPGPVQPFSRPISEFRASANKSLDLLRQTVQGAVTREIDQVIKKYLEKYFVPAVNNIRLNLGEESVSEDQVRAVCRAMLDATRLLYATPSRPAHSAFDNSESETTAGLDCKTAKLFNLQSSLLFKRKESDTDTEAGGPKRKKIKEEVESACTSPQPLQKQKQLDKWNPARLTQDTLFIMGSHAHKVLGLGNSRGRLYTKHSTLLRYPADSIDKEWIANHNLVNVVGGKTYIMVLEDIEELATSDLYRHNSLPMLGELTGFKVPPFMLNKIKDFVTKKNLSDTKSQINKEVINNCNEEQKYDIDLTKDDFPEIKDDGIKVMDIDDIKVEAMDDVTVKVEHLTEGNEMDDKIFNGIRVEDIKIENNYSSVVCKSVDNEDSDLVNGLLDSDIEFLSKNIGNIESDTDARKTIEKLTGANADTITLVGDEFDFGTTLNTNNYSEKQNPRPAIISNASSIVNSTPAAQTPAPATLHYYCTVPNSETVLTGINTKTSTLSTVMSQNATSIFEFGSRAKDTTFIGSSTQYVNVTAKTFSTGNILHNAIVSRNFINRTNFGLQTPKSNIGSNSRDLDGISTTKDMIDNACNSSVMLKQVLTLGSTGSTKSFMMHNTQKVLSTGFATGRGPPNMTVVSTGTPATSLSATHATLSALLSSRDNLQPTPK